MKKTIYFSTILAIVSVVAFSSCKKSSSSPSITGTWNETGGVEITVDSTTTPATVTTHDTTYTAPYPATLAFTSNGSFTFTELGGGSPEIGKYLISNNKLVLEEGGAGLASVANYSISGKTLTISIVEDTEPGVGSETEELILTKQ
ncbi:MAG TPA: hypothetical protein VK559_10510 [Ferruginibacter sp.]|nr:hypothetical protein [Ferruginibacter sp.]